jgi:probable HAF family extracellular repeat protein
MWWLALCIALCGCGAQSQNNLAAGTFTPLGTLEGYTASTASAVSSDGTVVVGTATTRAGARQAFRWTAAQQAMAIGRLPGGTWSSAMSVSDNGDVVVGEADGGTPPALHAFRWTADRGSAELPALQGASVCTATGISADAGVVSGTCLTINDEAFRWTEAAGTVGLGQFGSGSNSTSSASAVSGDGHIIGGAGHPALNGAVIWDARNVPFVIGTLPAMTGGTVSAMSNDGSIVVGVAADAQARLHAFRWSRLTGIGPLPGADFQGTYASGTSGDATRTVGWGSAGDTDTAIMWDEQGVVHRVLDLLADDERVAATAWQLSRARAISQDGRHIVGEGVNPQGATEAWRVTLPE